MVACHAIVPWPVFFIFQISGMHPTPYWSRKRIQIRKIGKKDLLWIRPLFNSDVGLKKTAWSSLCEPTTGNFPFGIISVQNHAA